MKCYRNYMINFRDLLNVHLDSAYCILRKLRIGCVSAQYMRKISARFSPNTQYMHKIVLLSPMRNICARFAQDCTYFFNVQYMRKIVLISPMRKICTRLYFFPQCAIYAQDCTYFSNAQYMRKICTRLYFFLQCAIYAQDCTSFPNAQDLREMVLISPTRNICARFAQDCTSFPNAQYMRKICARLYFFLQCAIYAQDLRKIVLLSPMRNTSLKVFMCSPLNDNHHLSVVSNPTLSYFPYFSQ